MARMVDAAYLGIREIGAGRTLVAAVDMQLSFLLSSSTESGSWSGL